MSKTNVKNAFEAALNGNPVADLAPALKAALQKHEAAKTEKTSNLLVNLLTLADGHVNTHLANVRAQKKAYNVAKEKLTKVGEAVEHFKKTSNPFPFLKLVGDHRSVHALCSTLGIPTPSDDDECWKMS